MPAMATPAQTENPTRTGVGGTLVACALTLVAALLWIHQLTHGFQAWTYDDRRAMEAQQGRIAARVPTLHTAQGERLQPWSGVPGSPRAYLVDFIYTSCPGVCQALGSEFARMQADLHQAGNGSVGLLSVSFDVAHDGPAALAAYARQHGADGRTWVVAVPHSQDASRRLLSDLQVVVVPDGSGGYVHNGAIHLLDAQGRLRGLYAFDQWPQALAAAQRLAGAAR